MQGGLLESRWEFANNCGGEFGAKEFDERAVAELTAPGRDFPWKQRV
jgi:hypothetical protein